MPFFSRINVLSITAILLMVLCSSAQDKNNSKAISLKTAFKDHFYMGVAVNRMIAAGVDSLATNLIETQYNSITAENDHKWEKVHPEKDTYDFAPAEKFMDLGRRNNMYIVGHVLIWHSQTPRWVFQNDDGNEISRKDLFKRMKDHIYTVAGHFKDINGWDVVNEAFNDDGSLRKSNWLNTLGESFLDSAFHWASKANPNAELFYNDFNMYKPGKVKGVAEMVKRFQKKGIQIDGIGMQGHWGLDYPDLKEAEEAIVAFGALGLKVHITELDVQMLPRPDRNSGAEISRNFELREKLNPYKDGLTDSMKTVIANRYRDIFELFVKHHEIIKRVTFWGIHNGLSWHNNWPVRGRTAYSLLFDRQYQPVPAFYEVIKTATP